MSEKPHITTDQNTGKDIYTVIASFSREAPIAAETLRPGDYTLARVLDSTTRETSSGYKLTGTVSEATKRSKNWLPRMAENGREWRENWAVKMDWNHNGAYIKLDRIPTADELKASGVTVPEDWEGLRVWRGQVSSQYDEGLGRYLEGGETQLIIDFDHPHNKVLEDYVKRLEHKPTNWSDVIFAPSERAAVRPLGEHELAPKTVPQGYTTRAPAAISHTAPDRSDAELQR